MSTWTVIPLPWTVCLASEILQEMPQEPYGFPIDWTGIEADEDDPEVLVNPEVFDEVRLTAVYPEDQEDQRLVLNLRSKESPVWVTVVWKSDGELVMISANLDQLRLGQEQAKAEAKAEAEGGGPIRPVSWSGGYGET